MGVTRKVQIVLKRAVNTNLWGVAYNSKGVLGDSGRGRPWGKCHATQQKCYMKEKERLTQFAKETAASRMGK